MDFTINTSLNSQQLWCKDYSFILILFFVEAWLTSKFILYNV